jgi:hypothetical protein
LHRRAAGRIDHERNRLGILGTEGALERLGDTGERHARPQRRHRADHAGQPHHRHHRDPAAEFGRDPSLQPLDKARQSHAITYLFTHADTSN